MKYTIIFCSFLMLSLIYLALAVYSQPGDSGKVRCGEVRTIYSATELGAAVVYVTVLASDNCEGLDSALSKDADCDGIVVELEEPSFTIPDGESTSATFTLKEGDCIKLECKGADPAKGDCQFSIVSVVPRP